MSVSNQCNKFTSPRTVSNYVQKILRNATRSENTFQSFNIEVFENFFSSFFKWPEKTSLLILQYIWFYIIISISKEI